MELIKRHLRGVQPHNVCVVASLALVAAGIIIGSFAGGAITMMLLAIYLKVPFRNPDDVTISLQSAGLLKHMMRKPRSEKELAVANELQVAFERAMKS